ncbi:hypothetical protein PG310_00435 [Riemerella anatipestifer]|uniref:hypothetical protein n=1 Tax=Riemerella anatipestifer TaxID=34085 RepID=UPI00129E1408|nr:hypothetical protein [Riemerella anatipestifer]MDY3524154.1 hypothetical protein [Riemerella anatipestifer]MRM83747.1 hypothetical protein [Riemerella anatipestifer]UZX28329.1 hypothetical protein OIS45_02725 [Riemerella anatipestifer]
MSNKVMKGNKYQRTILFLLAIFWILLQTFFALHQPVLSDDIGHLLLQEKFIEGEISFGELFNSYFEDPNRHSRPTSVLLMSLMHLFSITKSAYLFWGILSVVNIYLFYKILKLYFEDNNTFITLAVVCVLLFPLSSANMFSVVMQHIQYIVFAVLLSILLINKKSNWGHLVAGVLMVLSFLLYEINLFLTPLIGLLTIHRFGLNRNAVVKISLSLFFPLILFAVFRLWLLKIIHPNYFDYGVAKVEFSLERSFALIGAFVKLFTLDYLYILCKSVIEMVNYHWYDFILLLLGVFISALIVRNFRKHEKLVSLKKIFIFFFFFLLTLVLFFISVYPPIAFGFENRILIWVRYSSGLLVALCLYQFLTFTKNKSYFVLSQIIVFIVLLLNIVAVISEKNSYIAASDYNRRLVVRLNDLFPDADQNTKILVITEEGRSKEFITDESLLEADYEVRDALQLYSKSKLEGGNILFFNPSDYALYSFLGKRLNNRFKTECHISDMGITIGKRTLSFPLYIYDLNTNKIQLISNSKEIALP